MNPSHSPRGYSVFCGLTGQQKRKPSSFFGGGLNRKPSSSSFFWGGSPKQQTHPCFPWRLPSLHVDLRDTALGWAVRAVRVRHGAEDEAVLLADHRRVHTAEAQVLCQEALLKLQIGRSMAKCQIRAANIWQDTY